MRGVPLPLLGARAFGSKLRFSSPPGNTAPLFPRAFLRGGRKTNEPGHRRSRSFFSDQTEHASWRVQRIGRACRIRTLPPS
ncbi:hypothetical protein SKAU_G00381020 [Synaphobranchus kaupii]|uniref:Uncharacterized protein n=1 Tax=Synaphobranchus kaupii TaxID=118154 RepID=A0A9Q1EDQ5_SYNKA|nr:hypothetical protein SKAU_G00381020 [Synaphobranchus kaupii]